MTLLRSLHRWTGALIGLLLAAMGLSGALLAWKEDWIGVPGADAAATTDPGALARATAAMAAEWPGGHSIVFASDGFGLHRIYGQDDHGGYADAAGQMVTRWDSVWDRPELWLFDFHHHLLAGETGELAAGVLALIGIAFIVTGVILWWRTRRTFRLALWPRRMTQSAIVRQHRDLGVVTAPLLFLTCLTGAMMTLQPLSDVLLRPFSTPAEMKAATAPPDFVPNPAAGPTDWPTLFTAAQARFPDAELRVVRIPAEPGGLVQLRMKQPAEWLPNGRTLLWFAPDGRLIDARDAATLPQGVQLFNTVYPLHAGKVGGLVWKLAITAAGLALALLGLLASVSFWRARTVPKPRALAMAAR